MKDLLVLFEERTFGKESHEREKSRRQAGPAERMIDRDGKARSLRRSRAARRPGARRRQPYSATIRTATCSSRQFALLQDAAHARILCLKRLSSYAVPDSVPD